MIRITRCRFALFPEHPMDKRCANCALPVECAAPSPECWCKSIPAWQPIRETSSGCLCKMCLSLKFWSPAQRRTVWGL
jgi:hypothetical protein